MKSPFIKSLFVLLALIFTSFNSYASDTLFIKFLQRTITMNDFKLGNSIQVKDKNYLFLKTCNDESLIECFVFKKNILYTSGRLKIVKNSKQNLALRIGYWLYSGEKVYGKIYYIDDKEFIENMLQNEKKELR